MTIDHLPDEGLTYALTFVPPQEIPRLAGICRRWYTLIHEPTLCSILFQHYFPRLTPGTDVVEDYGRQIQIYGRIKRVGSWVEQLVIDLGRWVDRIVLIHGDHLIFDEGIVLDKQGRLISNFAHAENRLFSFHDRLLTNHCMGGTFVTVLDANYQQITRLEGREVMAVTEEECILWDYRAERVEYRNRQLEVISTEPGIGGEPPLIVEGRCFYYYYIGQRKLVRIDEQNRETEYRVPDAMRGSVKVDLKDNFVYITTYARSPVFDPKILVYSSGGGEPLRILNGELLQFQERSFYYANGYYLFFCNLDGTVVKQFQCTDHEHMIHQVFHFNRCVVGVSNGATMIWDEETAKELATFPHSLLWIDGDTFYFKSRKQIHSVKFSD